MDAWVQEGVWDAMAGREGGNRESRSDRRKNSTSGVSTWDRAAWMRTENVSNSGCEGEGKRTGIESEGEEEFQVEDPGEGIVLIGFQTRLHVLQGGRHVGA